jgi:hypothetical protein
MTEQDQLPPQAPTRADPDAEIVGVPGAHLLDLWQWAYSDLVSNDIRGVVAEYLVGSALGRLSLFFNLLGCDLGVSRAFCRVVAACRGA